MTWYPISDVSDKTKCWREARLCWWRWQTVMACWSVMSPYLNVYISFGFLLSLFSIKNSHPSFFLFNFYLIDLCLSAPQRDLPLYLKCLLHLLPFIALFPFCNYFIYLFACLFLFFSSVFLFLLLISLIISPVPSTVPQTQYALNKYLLNNEWMNHDIAKRASCTQTYIYLNNNWHISVVSQSICVWQRKNRDSSKGYV